MCVRISEAHRFVHYGAVPALFGFSLPTASWKCAGIDNKLFTGFLDPFPPPVESVFGHHKSSRRPLKKGCRDLALS
jgi:hypothetical protein